MKTKLILTIVLAMAVASCKEIVKKEDKDGANTVYYSKKDTNYFDGEGDCAYASGYRWSHIKDRCVRAFEVGFRLNPIELDVESEEVQELEDNEVSCFLIFNEDRTAVEIFLPGRKSGIVLEEKNRKGLYSNQGWILDEGSGMTLSYKDEIQFTAAKTIEVKLIGDGFFDDVE